MEEDGPAGFLGLMSPDWTVLSQATTWLEAAAHVILSIQLGSGVISSYAGYNKYSHSLIRDSWVVTLGNVIFSLLSVLLLLSLTGAHQKAVQPGPGLVTSSIFGDNVGLSNIVLVHV